jgi:rubrerythrin
MKVSRLGLIGCVVLLSMMITAAALGGDSQASATKPASEMTAPAIKAGTTSDNLQTCFDAESRESQLYTKYADKADAEGYHQVASMFRAVARAEAIHAAQKSELIKKMGGTPTLSEISEDPPVGTTRENVESASAAETRENETMYPAFVEQARSEKKSDAEHSFKVCMAAEPGHRLLFQQILKDMDGYRGDYVEMLVCPGCGKTVRVMREDTCPICQTPKAKFEHIK